MQARPFPAPPPQDPQTFGLSHRISCSSPLRHGRATTLFSRLTGGPFTLFVQSFADLEAAGAHLGALMLGPAHPRRVRALHATYI